MKKDKKQREPNLVPVAFCLTMKFSGVILNDKLSFAAETLQLHILK